MKRKKSERVKTEDKIPNRESEEEKKEKKKKRKEMSDRRKVDYFDLILTYWSGKCRLILDFLAAFRILFHHSSMAFAKPGSVGGV